MKNCILTLLLFLGHQTFSQNTFSKRYDFGFNNAVLTSIIPTDSCIYAAGIIADTIPPFNAGSILAKFDLNGEELFNKPLVDDSIRYETWRPSLHLLPNGEFVNVGYMFDPAMKAVFIRYNKLGDTVFTKEYLNPNFPEMTFIKAIDLKPIENNQFYFTSHFNPLIDDAEGDLMVLKLDSLGNILQQNVYGGSLTEDGGITEIDQDGNLVIGGVKTNSNQVWQNFISRSYIFQTDQDGFLEWEYLSNASEIKGTVNGLALTEDGGVVAASTGGYEEPSNPLISTLIWENAYFFKIDSNQQLVWELEVFDSIRPSPGNEMNKMIAVDGGKAFIACGRNNLVHSIDPPIAGHFAWFFKFSDEGKLIWIRKHQILDVLGHKHRIYDLKQTPDGGLIAAGEVRGNFGDGTPSLQGWLLKLDEHGCLIPGCEANDTVTSTIELPVEVPVQLAVHPNPASDYLNFQLRTPQAVRQAVFRIVDAVGRVVKEIESSLPRETHILPVHDWPAGPYFLQYWQGGRLRSTQPFMVQR